MEDQTDLTVDQAAEALEVSPTVIENWCRQQAFPHAYELEGSYRIPPQDVELRKHGGRLHDLQEPLAEE